VNAALIDCTCCRADTAHQHFSKDASWNGMVRLRLSGTLILPWMLFRLLNLCCDAATFVSHPIRISPPPLCHIDRRTTTPAFGKWTGRCILKLKKDDGQKRRRNGVYVRPSAAIERGSGFFVPGLEGFKVRILVGCVLMLLTIFNHWYDQRYITPESASSLSIITGNAFSENLAIVYGMLVLLQGIIEARKEGLSVVPSSSNDDTLQAPAGVKRLQQQWSVENTGENADWCRQVEWAASTYLSLTPATNLILIGPGKVVFSLGTSPRRIISDEDEALGCSAALATLAQSKSGRVSLPVNHVSVETLVPSSADSSASPRCAVLQRVDDQLCFLMTSDQLLVAFTLYDLQWLGQLAKYVNPSA
jgi:hypothetical protein